MDQPLKGKVAFVTGGGRGIGRAIAERLHRAGAELAITGRHRDTLEAVAAELGERVRTYAFDVRDRAACDAAADAAATDLGRLDLLVNNAGVAWRTPLSDDDEGDERWLDVIESNLSGTWFCTRAAVRLMPDHADARVVNISSVLGKFGVQGSAAYCAAKHGVIGLTRALALELAPRGIAVNAVCPGWVDTEMARHGMAESADLADLTYEDFRRDAIEAVPQKRMLDPAEVAGLVHYLCLPETSGITGQALSIDGGQTPF